MKLLTTKNEYKASNCNLLVSDDLKTVSAWSYSWWQFVKTDSVGNIYFNSAPYSVSTGKHQSEIYSVLHSLGITPHITFYNTRCSLDSEEGIKEAIRDEIRHVGRRIEELEAKILQKGTHKKTNEARRKTISELKYKQLDLNSALQKVGIEELAKKAPALDFEVGFYDDLWDRWVPLFTKPNGKIRTIALQEHLKYSRCVHDIPAAVNKLKALLGIKGDECADWLLRYEFIADTERMTPDLDSADYPRVRKWVDARLAEHPKNNLLLDKLHTYYINQLTRGRVTGENEFPIHPTLAKLQHPNLTVIKTDKQLRAEGRRQSHCIGSKHYIDACFRGAGAVNFKGFTFLLCPDMRVSQAHGRFNSKVPDKILNEFNALIEESKVLKGENK